MMGDTWEVEEEGASENRQSCDAGKLQFRPKSPENCPSVTELNLRPKNSMARFQFKLNEYMTPI